MPELLIPIFVFYLIYLYLTMKKPTTSTEKLVPKSTTEQTAAAIETNAVKSGQPPKSPKKAQVVASNKVAVAPEITLPERVGLTAGSIWHYLSENGASSVAKLVRELPEEEKIIQRSIGWLAQEGKITLETIDRIETIGLIS